MALARCEMHGKPVGQVSRFVQRTEPLGYPDSAILCPRAQCVHTGIYGSTKTTREITRAANVISYFPRMPRRFGSNRLKPTNPYRKRMETEHAGRNRDKAV